MTHKIEIPLAQQKQMLRLQLQAQRKLIIAQLSQTETEHQQYPRSMIMRFLTQHHGAKIIAEFATLALGTRMLKSMTSAFAVAKVVKALTANKPKE